MQAISESGLLCSSNGALASLMFFIGVYARPVFSSWRTRWRWEKVPRSVSWPVSRMWTPSVSSEEEASASAGPKSVRLSSSASIRRRSDRRGGGAGQFAGRRGGHRRVFVVARLHLRPQILERRRHALLALGG